MLISSYNEEAINCIDRSGRLNYIEAEARGFDGLRNAVERGKYGNFSNQFRQWQNSWREADLCRRVRAGFEA